MIHSDFTPKKQIQICFMKKEEIINQTFYVYEKKGRVETLTHFK